MITGSGLSSARYEHEAKWKPSGGRNNCEGKNQEQNGETGIENGDQSEGGILTDPRLALQLNKGGENAVDMLASLV